jgi:holo-[acyl-carrier protein] synthase
MTLAVGADLQGIDEVRESIEIYGVRYLRRIYTDREIADCARQPSDVARAFAARFAAKEAVFKILKDDDVIAAWKDIEVSLDSGRPVIALRGGAAQLASRQGIATIALSLSQSSGTAAAVVVAERASGSSR